MEKSHFYMDDKYRGWGRRVSRTSSFRQGSLPFEYLGVPIFRGIKKTAMFMFLRDKISKRIHSWSHKFLSFGGRLTLIKSTLAAIPLHIFQVMEPTDGVMKQMESTIARFFWGSSNDNKRTHWVAWEQICHPIEEGGLGIRRFKDMLAAFSMKLWWRFRERDSLWAEFMSRKYCHTLPPSEVKLLKRSSPTWRRMIRARARTQQNMRWSIGDGDVDFWDDIWLEDRTLRSYCQPEIILPRNLIRDFWTEDNWDELKLRAALLPAGITNETAERILRIPITGVSKDVVHWSSTPHGNFTTSSAWELIRHQQERIEVFNVLWNPAISPSMSIFVWRLLINRIPVDAKLQWRNIQLASKCRCCKTPRGETREHLFIQGEAATKIWRHFANWFPDIPEFPSGVTELEQRIRWWHSHITRAAKDHISILISSMILWFIWTERNNVIHRGAVFSSNMVIERIQNHLQWAILARKIQATQWKGTTFTSLFKFPRPRVNKDPRSRIVYWQPPQQGWIKLNFAGTFLGIALPAGGGGIIRDNHGRILGGYTDDFEAGSGVEAALKALNRGMDMARQFGSNIWLETDTQEVVGMIEARKRGAAEHRHTMVEVRNKLNGCGLQLSHTPKEGNRIATSLAIRGRREAQHVIFDQESAPPLVRALARLERLGIPNVRQHVEEE